MQLHIPRYQTRELPEHEQDTLAHYREWLRSVAVRATAEAVDRPNRQLVFSEDFIGASYDTTIWANTVTGGGSLATVDAIDGIMRLTTAAGGSAQLHFNARRPFDITLNPIFEVRIDMSAATDINVIMGLANPSNFAQDFIYLQNNAGGAAANWFGFTDIGGVGSNVDLGIAGDTNWNKLRFVVDSLSGGVSFYFNDILKGALSTNVPTASLQPILYAQGPTFNRTVDIDYCKIWAERVA